MIVDTFEQAIELTFKVNEAASENALRELEAIREGREKALKESVDSLSQTTTAFTKDKEKILSRYMDEFDTYLKKREDLSEDQRTEMEGAERERLTDLLSLVDDSNRQMLSSTSSYYKDALASRAKTVEQIIASEEEIRELESSAAEGEPQPSDDKSSIIETFNKALGYLHSMGFPIASLSVVELGKFALFSYDKRLEERRAEFKIAAAGGQLFPSGASFDMAGYTDGIRDLKQKFPSLRHEFDNVAIALKKQIPSLEAKELVGLVDDIRRLSFYTGDSMDSLAEQMGTMSRHLGIPASQLASKSLYIVELARMFSRTEQVNIDLGKFRQNVMQLADSNRLYGMTVEEAGGMVYKFAKELDRGILSLEDVAAITLGYSRAAPTQQAFLGQEVLAFTSGKEEFKNLHSLLARYGDNHVAMQRLVKTLAEKSEAGYQEMGIQDQWGNRHVLAQQMGLVVNQSLQALSQRLSSNVHMQKYINRQHLSMFQMQRGDISIEYSEGLAQAGREGMQAPSVPGGDMDSPEGKAAGPVMGMNAWRSLVDDNQGLIENSLERLWEMVRQAGAQVAEMATSRYGDASSQAILSAGDWMKSGNFDNSPLGQRTSGVLRSAAEEIQEERERVSGLITQAADESDQLLATARTGADSVASTAQSVASQVADSTPGRVASTLGTAAVTAAPGVAEAVGDSSLVSGGRIVVNFSWNAIKGMFGGPSEEEQRKEALRGKSGAN